MFSTDERNTIVEVCLNKDELGMTWAEITEHLNELLDRNYKDSKTYRKVLDDHLLIENADDVKLELQKEKYKTQDARREFRRDVRNQARIEMLQDRMIDAIRELPPINISVIPKENGSSYGIVPAADWHLGAKHSNFWGDYSVEIAKQRVAEYADDVISNLNNYDLKELLVLNLGDMIEGFIHVSIRVAEEINAIEQSILAGELFTQFVTTLYNGLRVPIKLGSILDNHSRIHPDKKVHIEAENLQYVIQEFVRLRLELADLPKGAISIVGNHIDENIGYYKLGGRNIVWVHGHLEKGQLQNIYDRLQRGLPFEIDELIMAHRHNLQIHQNIWQVPSMKGTDGYAKDNRLFSKPSQSYRVYRGNNKITFEKYF